MCARRHSLLLVLCLLLPLLAGATPVAAGEPQRVCLVLSGGGALGLAHVGVLKVLEEMHVPVDCVTGTSMGAIVGGLYAAGYSAAELERLALDTDWTDMLRDAPDRRYLPYRRKVDDLTYLTRWELGFSDGKLRLPSGLIAGQKLGVLLRVLCLRAAGVRDFDHLPRQFRAVAADIGTGETVVLADGDLAEALRASMAVPGLFSPVEIGGRLLVDGGVVANLPVEQARTIGAGTVIAVDLGQPLSAHERPESMPAILTRTSAFLTRLNVERALGGADLVIHPSLAEYHLLDFDGAREIVARGEAAARAQAEALRRYAVDDAAWASFVAAHRRETPEIRVSTVTIDPGRGLALQAVTGSLQTRAGRPLDLAVLEADMRRLYELGEFETVDFRLDPDGDAYALTITGHPKPWGPNFLRFGLSLYSDLEGASRFSLLADMTMTRLNLLGGELKVAARLGDVPMGQVELYQPVSTSRVPFVAVGAAGSLVKTQLPLGEGSVQYRYNRQRAWVDAGASLGRYGELRAGMRYDTTVGRATRDAGHYPRYDRTDAGYRLGLVVDQIDNPNFPRHGVLGIAELFQSSPSLGADDDYHRGDLQFLTAASRGRHTLMLQLRATSALGGTLPPEERLQLGGLLNLSGLPPGELSGSYGGVGVLVYFFRLGRLPLFGEGIYAGASVEAGNAWDTAAEVSLSDLRHSYALLFGADTILGPVYLGYAFASGGKDSFYLLVGRTF